jgi:hypothetical protein
LLALEAGYAAFCNGADRDNAGGPHEDWHFTGEITDDTTAQHLALADDVFDGFGFTFKDDEEAWFFAFTDEPLAGLDVNVGCVPRDAAAFVFFHTRKNVYCCQVSRGNHCVL